jgi:hypothetical protein
MERIEEDTLDAAVAEYLRVKDDLFAGRKPREKNIDGLTVAELANRFLTAKDRKVRAGELTQKAFSEYRIGTDLIVSEFGSARLVDDLDASDFEALRARMAVAWSSSSIRIR